MRNWANRACAAALAALVATAAAATPPQVIDVDDALFARNGDTLFLLRRITDNHGLHMVQQSDTLLIQRDLAGGDDRGFRGVSRVIDYGVDGDPRSEALPLSDPANPYDVFAAYEAWPVDAPRFWEPDDVHLDETGLWLDGYGLGGETRYALSLEAVTSRVQDTLRAGRGVFPLHRVGGGSTGPDSYDPEVFDILRDCSPGRFTTLWHSPEDPALVELTCQEEDIGQRARLWLVLPQR